MTTEVRGPDGEALSPQIKGPDGDVIPERLWPYVWSQPSREKGAARRPEGGLPYETAWAVVGPDGRQIGSVLMPATTEMTFWLKVVAGGLMALTEMSLNDLVKLAEDSA